LNDKEGYVILRYLKYLTIDIVHSIKNNMHWKVNWRH